MLKKKTISPIDESYFDRALTAFDLYFTRIEKIPLKSNLVPNVVRAKLSKCQLEHLPPGLESYIYIKTLELSDNQISEISTSEFSEFAVLQTLDLSINLLTKIDCSLPPTLTSLDLSFNLNLAIDSVWELFIPRLEVLKCASCNIKHLPETLPKWSSTIKALDLAGNQIQTFPKYFADFPLLEEVSFFGNEIDSIQFSPRDRSFKTINLSLNNVTSLPQSNAVQVQTMFLNSCPFHTVPLNFIKESSLRVLYLSKAQIQGKLDFQLPQTLAILDLSYNKINEITDAFASSCGRLSVLNLSHNEISLIANSFPEQNTFSQIILRNNKLTEVPESMLNAKALEQLNLSHNQLKQLPPLKLPQLRELHLSFNELESLPDTFDVCSFLILLDLSFNKLKDLPRSLTACRRMLDVYLSGNQFTVLPRCVMSFASMRCLVMAGNQMTALPSSIFSFFFLKTLDMSNNHIVTLPNAVSQLISLRSLSFSHNLITSIPDDFKFPESLVLLDLSFNKINHIPTLQLPNLVSLSLECNLLTDISWTSLKSIHFMTIANNQINIPFSKLLEKFSDSLAIRCLDISGNQIQMDIEIPDRMLITFEQNAPHEFSVGYGSTMGSRPTMEDCATVWGEDNAGVFAVFDGHAGFTASPLSSNELRKAAKRIVSDPRNNLAGIFDQIHDILKSYDVDDGCTGAIVAIKDRCVFTGGIGDSRVVRVTKNGSQRMTIDHKPLNRSEFERLKKNGLGVSPEGRIKRKLAVARALGDFWCGEGLYVTPDISTYTIDENDVGIIIACDGLWDVIDDNDAAEIVRKSVTAEDAALALKNYGFALGSTDNISVIVLKFDRTGGIDPTNTVISIPVVDADAIDAAENATAASEGPRRPAGRRRR